VGLGEITFSDEKKFPVVKYVKGKNLTKPSRIDIFMGGIARSQKYSLMYFNIIINPTIVTHIVKYLQPKSQDDEILSYRTGRYNPNWLYLGMWSPLLIPIHFGNFLFKKVKFYRIFIQNKIKQLLDKYDKNIT